MMKMRATITIGLIMQVALVGLVSAASIGSSCMVYGFGTVDILPQGEVKLVGFNFETASGVTLEELFADSSLVQNDDPAQADAIFLWNPETEVYDQFFQKTDGRFYDAADPTGTVASVSIATGEAFFFRSPAASTTTNQLYLSGTVSLENEASDIYSNRTVIANLYPTDLNLNSTNCDWSAATPGNLPTLADQVHVWNPEKAGGPGYENYFLKDVGGTNVWHSGVSPFPAADPIIPIGCGAIYEARGTFTNSIVRPFAL